MAVEEISELVKTTRRTVGTSPTVSCEAWPRREACGGSSVVFTPPRAFSPARSAAPAAQPRRPLLAQVSSL